MKVGVSYTYEHGNTNEHNDAGAHTRRAYLARVGAPPPPHALRGGTLLASRAPKRGYHLFIRGIPVILIVFPIKEAYMLEYCLELNELTDKPDDMRAKTVNVISRSQSDIMTA
jgi:hypothetical protein